MAATEPPDAMTFRMKIGVKALTLTAAPIYLAGAWVMIRVAPPIIFEVGRSFFEAPKLDPLIIFVNYMLISVMLFGIVLMLFQAFWRFGMAFLSYVRVSPDELEVCKWPGAAVRCKWTDVQRMGKSSAWGVSYHMFWMNNVESPKHRLATSFLTLPRQITRKDTRRKMAFGQFKGWPHGELEARVQTYAPHLFD